MHNNQNHSTVTNNSIFETVNMNNRDPSIPIDRPRRESLVKPTWPMASPGQVSTATLQKLGSDLDSEYSNEMDPTSGNNRVSNQKRDTELYDISCKVNIEFICIYL